MAWQKKPGAPSYANLANVLVAAISGTSDAWMVPWIELIPAGQVTDINALCAAGPPPMPTLDPADFLGTIGSNRLGLAFTAAQLGVKLGQFASVKVFEAYCENTYTAGWTQIYHELFHVTYDWWSRPAAKLTIPTGATKIRVRFEASVFNGGDVLINWGETGQRSVTYSNSNQWQEITVTGADHNLLLQGRYNRPGGIQGPYDSDCYVEAWLPAGVADYDAPALTQPATAIAPTAKTYTTIADLGKELDALENKLHWVLDFTTTSLETQINPMVADEILEVVGDDIDIPLSQYVIGFIVTVANIGNQTDVRFGQPHMLHRLGRVVMGNGTAWLPPVELSVSPMMLLKPDATITACRVQVFSPAVATVTTMVRAPLLG